MRADFPAIEHKEGPLWQYALTSRRPWLISDIYLDSAIGEVATRCSEFAAILKEDAIDGLIAALNRKASILTAATARAL